MTPTTEKNFALRIPADLYARTQEAARIRHMSANGFIVAVLDGQVPPPPIKMEVKND